MERFLGGVLPTLAGVRCERELGSVRGCADHSATSCHNPGSGVRNWRTACHRCAPWAWLFSPVGYLLTLADERTAAWGANWLGGEGQDVRMC